MIIWMTGISGAGKTTICEAILRKLKPAMPELGLVDGDVVRDVFSNDLDYSEPSRMRQIKRIQSLAKVMDGQGFVVLVAALYSHPELLAWNRANYSSYFEVYLDASLELVRARDPKGLYAKADAGEMEHVVGIDVPWHTPSHPDLTITASNDETPDAVARRIIAAVPRLAAAVEPAV
jgi:adenylylsulfate kinase-like enzyme